MSSSPQNMYDDAELAVVAIMRLFAEEYSDAGSSHHRYQKVNDEILLPFFGKHGEDGGLALCVAFGRLAANLQTVVLEKRLGHWPSQDELLAEIDRFEMHKIEQHQDDEDGPS